MKKLAIVLALAACGLAHADLETDIRNAPIPRATKVELVDTKVCLVMGDIALTSAKLRDAGLTRDELADRVRGGSAVRNVYGEMAVNYAYANASTKPMDVYLDVVSACKKVY